MNKVVLLAVNAKYIHSSLSVWALAAGIQQFARAEVETTVVEATINQNAADIAAGVAAHAPALVGVSTYIWNANLLPQLLCGLRARLPQAVIVLGGPEATFNAEHWLRHGANYVLRGEGERSFPALADALFSKAPPAGLLAGIPGLCRLADGRFTANPEEILNETPPNPYTPAWFGALGGRIAYLETSRGCPFSCAFCLSGQDAVRFFPLERAKQQLSALSHAGAQTVKLVDRTFNCNPARAYELFAYVIGLDTGCRFHFEVAADLFDEDTLSLLKTAPPGRIQLEAGIQSFYAPTLSAVSRRTDLKKVARNISALLSGGNIHVHVDLIAGLPLETFAEFQKSFNSAYALGAHQLQLGFLKLLHGCALRAGARALELHFADEAPYEITENAWMTAGELDTLRKVEDALEHAYNSGRFLSALQYVLAATGMLPFDLYCGLGRHAPHGGMPLGEYAQQLYTYFCGLPGVRREILRDHMVCDLLAGAKGESLPPALRVQDARHRLVAKTAADFYGRSVPRRETAVLRGRGQGVFVGPVQNRVTGLWGLHFVELPAQKATGQKKKKKRP